MGSQNVTVEIPRRVASDFVQSPASPEHHRAEKAIMALVSHALESEQPTSYAEEALARLERDVGENRVASAIVLAGPVPSDPKKVGDWVGRVKERLGARTFEPGAVVRDRWSADERESVCVVVSHDGGGLYTIAGPGAGPGTRGFDPGAEVVDGVAHGDLVAAKSNPLLSVAREAANRGAPHKQVSS